MNFSTETNHYNKTTAADDHNASSAEILDGGFQLITPHNSSFGDFHVFTSWDYMVFNELIRSDNNLGLKSFQTPPDQLKNAW